MTGQEIQAALSHLGAEPGSRLVRDERYALPARDWMNRAFAAYYREYLLKMSTWRYQADQNDCDNFALAAMAMANLCHIRTSDQPRGVAVGLFDYIRDDGVGHELNFFFSKEADQIPRLIFWEPQLAVAGRFPEVTLSQDEIESCFGYVI